MLAASGLEASTDISSVMARIIEGEEDWHTFVLRAWADADAEMMALALQEEGAKKDGECLGLCDTTLDQLIKRM